MSASDVVIVGAKRTAIGSFLGQFTGVPTPQLGSTAIAGALAHAGLAPDQVDEVIMGCVLPAGLGQAPARQASLGAQILPAERRSEEHTSELQSLMRNSYAVFCLKKTKTQHH